MQGKISGAPPACTPAHKTALRPGRSIPAAPAHTHGGRAAVREGALGSWPSRAGNEPVGRETGLKNSQRPDFDLSAVSGFSSGTGGGNPVPEESPARRRGAVSIARLKQRQAGAARRKTKHLQYVFYFRALQGPFRRPAERDSTGAGLAFPGIRRRPAPASPAAAVRFEIPPSQGPWDRKIRV
jgi:hypothetical protein